MVLKVDGQTVLKLTILADVIVGLCGRWLDRENARRWNMFDVLFAVNLGVKMWATLMDDFGLWCG
jgi:hypothetical protein